MDDPVISGQDIAAWQLDQDGPAAYEAHLVNRFFRRWARRLVTQAAATPGERVLDAGCGTGIVARTAADAVAPDGTVTALDRNEGMLDEARRRDPAGRVSWQVGALEELPFDDGCFDLVLSQQVLQFVDNRPEALAEVHRVLAPEGRFVFALLRDIEHNPAYAALADALDTQVGPTVAEMMRSPFAGPDTEVLRQELQTAGFENIAIRHDIIDVRFPSAAEFLRQETASSPLAGPMRELEPSRLRALLTALERVLAPFTDCNGVAFPMETRMVTALRA